MRTPGSVGHRLSALLGLLASSCLAVTPEKVGGASVGGQGGNGAGGGQTSGGQVGAMTGGGSCLTVNPVALDFGLTLVDATSVQTIALSNSCSAAVNGIVRTIGGVDATLFTADDVPTALAAGASAEVNLSYSPLALESPS